MFGFDQGIRNKELRTGDHKIKIFDLLKKGDEISFNKLVSFIEYHGYPNENMLGSFYKNDCVKAAALVILLHNPHRLVNEKKYFDLFLNEVKIGNMPKEIFASVIDKYYWAKTKREYVLYGSQFGKPCIKNKIKTNKARLDIGLKPLKNNEFKICTER